MDLNVGLAPISPVLRSRRLLNNHESLISWMQQLADALLVCGSLFALADLKLEAIPSFYRLLAVVAIMCMWLVYRSRGVYRQSTGYLKGLARLTLAWLTTLLILALIGFVTKTGGLFSREVLIEWAFIALALQAINFYVLSVLYKFYKMKFSGDIRSLVLGTGPLALYLVDKLNSNCWLPDDVIGFVRSDDEVMSEGYIEKLPLPLLGQIEELRQLIRECKVRRVYITLPVSESGQLEALNFDLLDLNVDVIWVPDIFCLRLLNHSVREVAGIPLISLNETPLTSRRSAMFLKNVMDKILALLALITFSPLMLAVAVAIKHSSPGPVFFKQDRHGWDGKVFKVWKFRSMQLHDDTEVKQAIKGDSRVTKFGAFIRKTSIDELPQFFNVLQGSMSLVGPRPHAVAHNDYYSDKVNAYLARHRIKPGITGLAQISGSRGETETIDKMQKRVEFDLAYINNWSLGLDIKILIKTPLSLVSRDIY